MDKFDWISPGFGLRTRDGKKTYVVQYKIGNQHRRMTLGSTDKLTKEEAKKEAKKIFGKVAAGRDPQGEEKAKRTASVVGTFKAIAEQFTKHQAERRRASTVASTTRHLIEYAKPLHGLKLDASLGRAQVVAVLKSVAKDHGPVAADRCRSSISAALCWAIRDGLCAADFSNPVTDTNKYSDQTASPGRCLSDEEIKGIWNAVDDDDFGRIVKLLILTGCRRNEIALLRWEEVDGDMLVIPGERTKNRLKFEVPLSGLASDILRTGSEGAVFGKRGTGFSGFSKCKRELCAKLVGVKPWRLHDLRHTVSTKLHEDLNVEPHIVEACINHISGAKGGVAGRYNHAAYRGQKRAALEAWASRIAVITGKNVTDIGRHRKARRA